MKLENFKNGYDVTLGSVLAKGEINDCSVRALANAFNITYDTAHMFAATTLERKARKGLKSMFAKLDLLGEVTFDLFSNTLFPETKTYKLDGKLKPRNPDYTHKKVAFTVKTFCAKFNKGTYILIVNKHALCVKDGIVIDNPNYKFTGYRRVVESSFRVK
tara:strand:+ start:170 stop:649 length:480 start_codon:yes stop_codon:yes gene_type:complete